MAKWIYELIENIITTGVVPHAWRGGRVVKLFNNN